MASWGEIAVGEYRHSADHPTKSAIIGMVEAALGIRRENEEMHSCLSDSLGVACLVRDPGTPIEDYHTIQTPPQSALKSARYIWTRKDELSIGSALLYTIESRREYRCDTFAHVCLWEKEGVKVPYSLEQIAHALNSPRFCLSLGRKSCPPGLPVHARVIEVSTLLEAFMNAEKEITEILRLFHFSPVAAMYWESDGVPGIDVRHIITRRDEIASRKRWTFLNRAEHYGVVRVPAGGGA
jgi:CRISPR system Cascade subunit CasD